jgi:hypothetical protein
MRVHIAQCLSPCSWRGASRQLLDVRSPFAPALSLARCYLLFYGATSRFAKRRHQLGVVRTTVAGEGERGIVG